VGVGDDSEEDEAATAPINRRFIFCCEPSTSDLHERRAVHQPATNSGEHEEHAYADSTNFQLNVTTTNAVNTEHATENHGVSVGLGDDQGTSDSVGDGGPDARPGRDSMCRGRRNRRSAEVLRESWGDLAQGYHFAKPLSREAMENLLSDAPLTRGTAKSLREHLLEGLPRGNKIPYRVSALHGRWPSRKRFCRTRHTSGSTVS
jgi:hypothetical protein